MMSQAQAEELLHKGPAGAAAALERVGAAAEQHQAASALPHSQELVAMSQDPSMEVRRHVRAFESPKLL